MNKYLLEDFKVDYTFLNIVSMRNMKARLRKRKKLNRYDKFNLSFYKKVQNGFLKIYNKRKSKYHLINSNLDIEKNKEIIQKNRYINKMNLTPMNQTKLLGLQNELKDLISLFKKKLPNKILFSGLKGSGKCTLAYHLINYILSDDEEFKYDIENFSINKDNKSFKLIQNGSSPNFSLIDITPEKNIDISQIRNLIKDLNKSSFNSKLRFILIDNIENLNLNSANALLKILEEPPKNTIFILINNDKKILPTIKSRCLNFRVSLSNQATIHISNELFSANINDLINNDLLNYYITPGKIYNLIKFSKENQINLKILSLKEFMNLIIDENFYKKDTPIKFMIYDFVEFFLIKKFHLFILIYITILQIKLRI